MSELAFDLTYADALLQAARETNLEDRILAEGTQIAESMEQEPDLKGFLAYPGISAIEKKRVIREIFKGRICQELLNFLCVLVDKRRAGRYESIMKAYRSLLEKEEGVLRGTVLSVIGLEADQIAEMETEVSRLLQTKVRLTNEMDPGILAGVKVLIDGKIIDASYRKKLDELSVNMRRA